MAGVAIVERGAPSSVGAPVRSRSLTRVRLVVRPAVSGELVPRGHDFTYDILPAPSTGVYLACGALIGSTLEP